MAIAIALPEFNGLGRSVTPIFLLMDHLLHQFSTLSEKMKKIYRFKSGFFAKYTIEFRPFKLFVTLCSDFKCLLKGYVF